MSLLPVDTSNALAVSDYLTAVRDWLATAVEMTGPAEIAAARAEIATAAEATRQLDLSKEIQMDAVEMVRRAEYALGRAVRKGQEDGTVTTRADGAAVRDHGVDDTKISARSLFGSGASKSQADVMFMADAIQPIEFEAVIADAKAEGDLSRANVVRKIKGQDGSGLTRLQRAELIEDLALQGYTSRQMTEQVGVTEETVRQIARDFDVEIPADRTSLRTRRINPAQVVENTATALEGLAMGVELIAAEEIDPALASQWADSLRDSMKALNAFTATIRKRAR